MEWLDTTPHKSTKRENKNMVQNYTIQDIQNGIDLDNLVLRVPSVGKSEKWNGGKLSDRYTVLPTVDILKVLEQETGFIPTFATQSRSRIEGKEDYTKHYIRLAHKDTLAQLRAMDRRSMLDWEFFEVTLVNSFDGSSAYDLHQAVTRLVCLNGLIVSNPFSTVHVRHTGNIMDDVLAGTVRLASQSGGVLEDIHAMKNTRLDSEQALSLAQEIFKVRFGEVDTSWFDYTDLLRKDVIRRRSWRRAQDYTGDSLWEYMNLVQENAVQGGMYRYDRKGDKHTARQVKGIDQLFKINERVWEVSKSFLN